MDHIKEYSHFMGRNLEDIFSDMEEIGLGGPNGWIIYTIAPGGKPVYEMIICEDIRRAMEIYNKEGIFKGHGEKLVSFLANATSSKHLTTWGLIDGFKAISSVGQVYKRWDGSNPYYTVECLDYFFSNAKEIMEKTGGGIKPLPPGGPTEFIKPS
jgi:hypothetical protein